MDIYERLGVRKLVNGQGAITKIGGTIMAPEVLEAMVEASKSFVVIEEFLQKAGEHLAKLIGVEAVFITSGSAAGLVVATAACVAGKDPAKIARLPDTTGMKNEVIVHRQQRNHYDNNVRTVGVRFVEIGLARETHAWELQEAISDKTAAVIYFPAYAGTNSLPLPEVVRIAHAAGVPVIVDAAAELPPVENLRQFLEEGADLAIFSGGKAISAPNPTGIIVGRKDLIQACTMANTPNHQIGRPMKLGKEELAGLYAAVKWYLGLDHKAREQNWERKVAYIVNDLKGIPGVTAERDYPGESGVACPRVRVAIDEKALGRTMGEILKSLRSGDPWIAVGPDISLAGHPVNEEVKGFFVNPQTLEDGEEQVVAMRLRQAFGAAVTTTAGR